MKYETLYPSAYDEGVRNKSITLSGIAVELLRDNEIENESAFINDLIIEALQEKDFFKKRLLGSINTMANDYYKKYGKKLYINTED